MSTVVNNTSFKYRPLNEPDSIRLILLKPFSSDAAQVECSLLHTTLSICDRDIIDHYTALSYVWGDASQTRQILVDGHVMTITATLEAALRDLRDNTRSIRVWADALCIDQSNVEERNQQVRQMGRIYSTAHHTIIYLGPLTPQVVSLLEAVSSKSSGIPGKYLPDAAQIAEHSLLNRPWFSRAWVFQELVLSRDPWVQCGAERVRWVDLCDLLLSNRGNNSGLKLLSEMHHARERRAQTNLFHLLLQRRGLGATDARDMIFAHLGVASDRANLEGKIIVDYDQSLERLYEDAAQYFIETQGPGTAFFHIDTANHSARRLDLASWAPDWSLAPSLVRLMYKDNRMNVVALTPKPHYLFIQEPRVLGYIGYEVDIISNVSLLIGQTSQRDSASRMKYQQTVRDLHSLYASVGGSYASGDKYGQYTRMPLEGKEEEHEKLCLKIRDEWLHLMQDELPLLSPPATEIELDSHHRFISTFNSWFTERARKGIIYVGGDSEGMESLMYIHLDPGKPPSILNERKLAGTKGGRVAVVPSQARDGDIIAYLAGNPISVVLRPTAPGNPNDISREIIEGFKEKRNELMSSKSPYVDSFMRLLEQGNEQIGHTRLVGECYVEGVIGWSLKERNDHHDFKIFALH